MTMRVEFDGLVFVVRFSDPVARVSVLRVEGDAVRIDAHEDDLDHVDHVTAAGDESADRVAFPSQHSLAPRMAARLAVAKPMHGHEDRLQTPENRELIPATFAPLEPHDVTALARDVPPSRAMS